MPGNHDSKDPDQPRYPLMTNQPGALLLNPVRRIRFGVLMLALAIVVGSGLAAYTATSLAGQKTDQHTDELLAELDKRAAERRRNEAVAAAEAEQTRRTLCELLPAVRPNDAVRREKIRRLIVAYRCGTAKDPIVPPGWSPPPSWPPLPPGTRGPTPTPTTPPTPGG